MKIEVPLPNESVRLTTEHVSDLFQRNKLTISRHIKNILKNVVLHCNSVVVESEKTVITSGI